MFENQTRQESGEDGGGDAACGGLQTAGEDAQKAAFRDCLPHALGQGVAEPQQGHRGTRPGEVHQGLIDPGTAQDHPQYHIAHQDPGGSQLGIVDEQLGRQAQSAAHQKSFYIIHIYLPPVMHTAWQTPGMGRFCWVEVGESRAPVPQKRIFRSFPHWHLA